jgi:hypothetical protein
MNCEDNPKNYKELKFWQTTLEATILVIKLVKR